MAAPQAPAGHNSLFAAYGYTGTAAMPGGAQSFRVMGMSYGIEMDYVEKENQNSRTVYFSDQMDDNFAVGLGFNGWEEYNNAALWFTNYASFVLNQATVNPMAVIIPMLNFNGIGIPTTGVTFGDSMVELLYVLNITFEGTYVPLVPPNNQTAAPFHGQSQYFYPDGLQQGATAQTTEIELYNVSGAITPLKNGGQANKPVYGTGINTTAPSPATVANPNNFS